MALVPSVVPQLVKSGLDVIVERGAGESAGFPDADYEQHGAHLGTPWSTRSRPTSSSRCAGRGLDGHGNLGGVASRSGGYRARRSSRLTHRGTGGGRHKLVTLALDLVPRITRAQGMDALSSQATVTGSGGRAGGGPAPEDLPDDHRRRDDLPGAVFVVGAGVAGLQAIATARRLGAVVEAATWRPPRRGSREASRAVRPVRRARALGDAEDGGGCARRAAGDAFCHRQRS